MLSKLSYMASDSIENKFIDINEIDKKKEKKKRKGKIHFVIL